MFCCWFAEPSTKYQWLNLSCVLYVCFEGSHTLTLHRTRARRRKRRHRSSFFFSFLMFFLYSSTNIFPQCFSWGDCGGVNQRQWQVHRVLRPEAYGGLLHNMLTGKAKTPLPKSILENKVGHLELFVSVVRVYLLELSRRCGASFGVETALLLWCAANSPVAPSWGCSVGFSSFSYLRARLCTYTAYSFPLLM